MGRGTFARTKKLREASVTTKPHISIERAVLFTEAYKKWEGSVEMPVLRALSFKHFMENRTLCINDGELIVGEKGDSAQGSSYISRNMLSYNRRYERNERQRYS